MTAEQFSRALFHLLCARNNSWRASECSRRMVDAAWAKLDAMIAMQKAAG